MSKLSPAAQAVLDAFRSSHTGQGCLAAALRAAADGWRTEIGGITQTDFIRGVLRGAEALEEIADELEAQQSDQLMKTLIEQLQGACRNIRGECADCGGPIGQDKGPPDGWQLEDGRTVCHSCCRADFRQLVNDVLSN